VGATERNELDGNTDDDHRYRQRCHHRTAGPDSASTGDAPVNCNGDDADDDEQHHGDRWRKSHEFRQHERSNAHHAHHHSDDRVAGHRVAESDPA
jgi:hypothetical protein